MSGPLGRPFNWKEWLIALVVLGFFIYFARGCYFQSLHF